MQYIEGAAEKLIYLHETEGFPIELSIEMAAEKGVKISLLELTYGLARRDFGRARFHELVNVWYSAYKRHMTPGETRAVEAMGY